MESTPQQPPVSANRRRIIKPAHPKANAAEKIDDAIYNNKNKTKEQEPENEDGFERILSSSRIYETTSPTVARQIEKEKASHQTAERQSLSASRRLVKREKKLQDRRQHPQVNEEDHNLVTSTTTTTQNKANPMSRFLSVFSVEASHPKRAHSHQIKTSRKNGKAKQKQSLQQLKQQQQRDDKNESATAEPVEKRPRTDTNVDVEEAALVDKEDDSNDQDPIDNNAKDTIRTQQQQQQGNNTMLLFSSAVLVAVGAVVLGLALQWGRRSTRHSNSH